MTNDELIIKYGKYSIWNGEKYIQPIEIHKLSITTQYSYDDIVSFIQQCALLAQPEPLTMTDMKLISEKLNKIMRGWNK